MGNNRTDDLLQAAGRGVLEKVQTILDSGTDVNASNEVGYTALMSAARSYRSSVLSFLLFRGADPRQVCSAGGTALHAAVGETPSQPEVQVECIKLLIEAGAEVEAQTNTGTTPLMNAAWFGCSRSVEALLSAGASIAKKDKEGISAEDLAWARGHDAVLELLLSKKTV